MRGFRARLGFILAPGNTSFENEVHSLMPHGVTAHFTRMPSKIAPRDQIALSYQQWTKNVEEYAKLFELADVKCIALANTVGSLALGQNGDEAIINRMQQTTGVKCTTALSSLIKALRKLGAKRVGLVFPYSSFDNRLNDLLTDIFNSQGITVKAKQNVPLSDSSPLERQIPDLDPIIFYQTAMKIADSSSDLEAIVSPSTNLPSADVINDVEHDTGKYVVTGTQAICWDSLRIAGINDNIAQGGALFSS